MVSAVGKSLPAKAGDQREEAKATRYKGGQRSGMTLVADTNQRIGLHLRRHRRDDCLSIRRLGSYSGRIRRLLSLGRIGVCPNSAGFSFIAHVRTLLCCGSRLNLVGDTELRNRSGQFDLHRSPVFGCRCERGLSLGELSAQRCFVLRIGSKKGGCQKRDSQEPFQSVARRICCNSRSRPDCRSRNSLTAAASAGTSVLMLRFARSHS